MQASLTKAMALAVAAVLALGAFDDASAAHKKRHQRADAPLVERDYDGTPMIMREEGGSRKPARKDKDAKRAIVIPRGSGTYIPPPNPSPRNSNLPASALTKMPAPTPPPAPIRTYNDRVLDCIHSAPLNAGVGNNPSDRQMYIRQCSN